MSKNIATRWEDKYRPKVLKDYIGNEVFKASVKKWIDTNDVPHLLLEGSPGTGKCLDFSERIVIEIELTEEDAVKLKQYIVD